MRKVVANLFISLDGVTDDPGKWQGNVFDNIMIEDMKEQLGAQDTVLLGRVTYDYWAAYWPSVTGDPYASFINNTPKYVASTTLKKVDWQNSTLISGDLADTIKQLKQQQGGVIGTAGSPTLVRSLLKMGLLDELHLYVHPVVVGKGNHLFDHMDDLKRLKLSDSKTTSTGVLLLTYQPSETK